MSVGTVDFQMGGVEGDRIFLGTDITRDLEVLDWDADPSGQTPKDLTGSDIAFEVRKTDNAAAAKLFKTVSLVGVYSATRSANTQRARLVLSDEDLSVTRFGSLGGTFRHSWKRTNAEGEVILGRGDIVIERATQV